MSRRIRLLIVVIIMAVAGAGILAYGTGRGNGTLDWISSKDNTYPQGLTLEIRDEGEYPWFGSVKVAYDLPVKAGQFICARVDANNHNYSWEVMIYWRASNVEASSMVQMGAYPWAFPQGRWRCHEVRPMYRADTGLIYDMVVYRAHWVGYGHGGVVATPLLVVSDVDLSE